MELGTIVTATSGSPFSVMFGGGADVLKPASTGFSMDYPNLIAGCNATPGVTRMRRAAPRLQSQLFRRRRSGSGVLVGNAGATTSMDLVLQPLISRHLKL